MMQQSKLKILMILIVCSTNVKGQNDQFQLKLPEIEGEHVQLAETSKNEYLLRIYLPDSDRFELLSFDPSDAVVQVQGTITTNYPKSNANLVVNYVADKNGYRASFKFGSGLAVLEDDVTFDTRISVRDFKSLTG